jgi:hypothetical protein
MALFLFIEREKEKKERSCETCCSHSGESNSEAQKNAATGVGIVVGGQNECPDPASGTAGSWAHWKAAGVKAHGGSSNFKCI